MRALAAFLCVAAQPGTDWIGRHQLKDVTSIDCLHRLQNDATVGCESGRAASGEPAAPQAPKLSPVRKAPAAPSAGGAVILPNAHPDQWQGCAERCPTLRMVPDACKEPAGAMAVRPECFHFTCELLACLQEHSARKDATLAHTLGALQVPRLRGRQPAPTDGLFAPISGDAVQDTHAGAAAAAMRDDDSCAAVRDEVWATVAHKGFDAEAAAHECEAGTFDCLLACPDLHTLTTGEDIAAQCAPGSAFHAQCDLWLGRVNDCVATHGVCGKTAFAHLPPLVDGRVDPAALGTLTNVSQSMVGLVAGMQEAFERTFMAPCDPPCADGACIHGKCVSRPFDMWVKPPEDTEPAEWFSEFAGDRPNHPQLDDGRAHSYVDGQRMDRPYTAADLADAPTVS